jgi:transposase
LADLHDEELSTLEGGEVWLLPPPVREWVPNGHAAHLVRDIVAEELDLSATLSTGTEPGGYPPYHPVMMVALLLMPTAAASTRRGG